MDFNHATKWEKVCFFGVQAIWITTWFLLYNHSTVFRKVQTFICENTLMVSCMPAKHYTDPPKKVETL
jgi:hypothetical protein